MKCKMCLGEQTIYLNDGNDEVDCPVCEGNGEWDGPHICGVRVKLVEATDEPNGDPVGRGGMVFMWCHTAEQVERVYGPKVLEQFVAESATPPAHP